MSDNPWMNQPDADPFDDMPSAPLKSYADPVANAEVQRLRAKVARVEALAESWIENGSRRAVDRYTAREQLRACGQILRDLASGINQPPLTASDPEERA